MFRSFRAQSPEIAASAYVDPAALLIGDVVLGDDSSIWPLVVIRADLAKVSIGARSNIQDASVLHVSPSGALTIGDDVTVGHACILHACTIEDRVLIGMGSTVLDGVVIESEVVVGAGSLVPPGKVLSSGYLYIGNPVAIKRPLRDDERKGLAETASRYVVTKTFYEQAQKSDS